MEDQIKNLIEDALKKLKIKKINFSVEHPEDFKNGDYSTNVAMVCAKKLKLNPKELATEIVKEISKSDQNIAKIEIAGAGFINFYLSREFFSESVEKILNTGESVGKNDDLKGQKIMIEYTNPNPFKPFHIGHLMTNAIGESIARILEHSGASVSRANYQGDVGLHVAKAIWGLLKNEKLQDKTGSHTLQATNIGLAYADGSEAYEDSVAKKEIDEINKKIYSKKDKKINEIYDWGFDVTMKAFEDLYRTLGTKFEFYFLESQMAPIGEEIVRANLGETKGLEGTRRIFEKSDGAIVFKAEKFDPKLHTRVFITSEGLPTYETKELGLTEEKFKTEPNMELCIVVTGNEQMEYMRVVSKAVSLINPAHESKMKHITHGMMRLAHEATAEGFASIKMSSRKGNVITGETLLHDTKMLVLGKMKDRNFPENKREKNEKIAEQVAVAAIKYSILRQSAGGDVIYNPETSISFEGDSGPYLQYAYTRAKSILEKAQKENILPDFDTTPVEVLEVEKLLYRFPEVVLRSSLEYEPHYIANYLIEVARAFNSFYGNTVIVKKEDETSAYKVALTYAFTLVMKNGLHLLGIEVPEKM